MNEAQTRDVPVATWLSTGVGIAGLATGIVATLAASKTRAEVNDTCVQDGSSTLCPSYATGLLDRHQNQRTLAWAGYGSGLVGLGVTTLLVITPVELGAQWEVRW